MKRIVHILIFIFLSLLIYPQLPEGPNNPTNSGIAGAGINWVNPNNGFISDNNRARTANMATGDNSRYIGYTGFGFSVPAGSTISGIQVDIERSRNNAGAGRIRDLTVRLTKDGATLVGNNLAATTTNWPSSDAYRTYGGSANLWGTTWTDAEINAATFGVAIRVRKLTPNGNRRARIDHVRITIYYINPLPIELISFEGEAEDGNVVLKWITASETNNDYFTIEKSRDAFTYEVVTTVEGAGNSNTIQRYSATDINANHGVSYYRLKQTDFDGKYKYSNIIAVQNSKIGKIRIYPNPLGKGQTISIEGLKESDSILIMDVNGKICNINSLESGTYLIFINDEFVEKIIVK